MLKYLDLPDSQGLWLLCVSGVYFKSLVPKEELGFSLIIKKGVLGLKLKDAFLKFGKSAHLIQGRLVVNLILLYSSNLVKAMT